MHTVTSHTACIPSLHPCMHLNIRPSPSLQTQTQTDLGGAAPHAGAHGCCTSLAWIVQVQPVRVGVCVLVVWIGLGWWDVVCDKGSRRRVLNAGGRQASSEGSTRFDSADPTHNDRSSQPQNDRADRSNGRRMGVRVWFGRGMCPCSRGGRAYTAHTRALAARKRRRSREEEDRKPTASYLRRHAAHSHAAALPSGCRVCVCSYMPGCAPARRVRAVCVWTPPTMCLPLSLNFSSDRLKRGGFAPFNPNPTPAPPMRWAPCWRGGAPREWRGRPAA